MNVKGNKAVTQAAYFVYVLECADGTLYVGSTNDIEKRIKAHNGELPGGARYTSGRRPVLLRYSEECEGRGAALKREHTVKNLSRKDKLTLIK